MRGAPLGDDFDRKIRFLARQLSWIVVGFFVFFATGWGIYVGYIYSSDECVRKTPYSLALGEFPLLYLRRVNVNADFR